MKISGCTFVRNATKYYFPIKESIMSILPIVDEFIIALGESDSDDNTESEILSIKSDKIKIYKRVWDEELFKMGAIYSHETNFALSKCTGDWCFCIQADEAVHEKYLPVIKKACEKYQSDFNVDGFLFQYRHFWGDYNHIVDGFHGWYSKEIRIIRNNASIQSVGDAQSFRKLNGDKLNVIEIPGYIYHYGWVRPPQLMRGKKKEQESQYWGKDAAEAMFNEKPLEFDYGALGRIPVFKETHPSLMEKWIANHNWQSKLNSGKKFVTPNRGLYKHEKLKYRILTFIEKNFLAGKRLFDYQNWNVVGKL